MNYSETSKEKLISWLNKPYKPEPRADIKTPVGPYTTTVTLCDEFQVFLKETAKDYTGAIGGQYTFSFTPTSLGLILEIKDGISERIFNATDYNSW